MAIIGLLGMTAGLFVLSLVPEHFGVAGYIGPLVVVTTNYALFQAANNTTVMTGIGPDHRGVVSGMLSLSRNLGLITGASVMGAIFALASGTNDIASAQPEAVAGGMRFTFAVAAMLIVTALAIAAGSRVLMERLTPPGEVS
jgi:Na+/melibiose symporter-like transporter